MKGNTISFPFCHKLLLLLGLLVLLAGSMPKSASSATYGNAADSIQTFDGWTLWLGWQASFSETYIPESESYNWVLYFSPDGIYVALQSGCARYSGVDVNLGFNHFVGALMTPDGGNLTSAYVQSLLGISFSLSFSINTFAPVGPMSGFSFLSPQYGPTLFRTGENSLNLVRGIQYSDGFSTSYSLLPVSIPVGVSLDYSTDCSASQFHGFYPIFLWTLQSTSTNPVNDVVAKLKEMASVEVSDFYSAFGKQLSSNILPLLNSLTTTGPVSLSGSGPFSPSDYFGQFFQDHSRSVPASNPENSIDSLIQKTEQWLRTGDTSGMPEALDAGLPVQSIMMEKNMRPVHAAIQTAFEVGYKRRCDYENSIEEYSCDKIYAPSITQLNCRAGEPCVLTITARELVDLANEAGLGDATLELFEGAWIRFQIPSEYYLTSKDIYEWRQITKGEASLEFTLSGNYPQFLAAGLVWDYEEDPNGIWFELSRRLVTLVIDGDFSHNGRVDLADAVLALQVVSGIESTQTPNRAAECNCDGLIGLHDVMHILQLIAGLKQ